MNLHSILKQVDLSLGKWIDTKDRISQSIILNMTRVLLFGFCVYIIGLIDFKFSHMAENIIINICRIDICIFYGIMILPLLVISIFLVFSLLFIFSSLLKRCFSFFV